MNAPKEKRGVWQSPYFQRSPVSSCSLSVKLQFLCGETPISLYRNSSITAVKLEFRCNDTGVSMLYPMLDPINKSAQINCLHCRYAKHYAEVAVGIAGAADTEAADLACVLYMCSEAGTYIVVAYID